MTVTRRNFLGWAGAAAVAGVAPGPIMALAELAAPPVAGAKFWIDLEAAASDLAEIRKMHYVDWDFKDMPMPKGY